MADPLALYLMDRNVFAPFYGDAKLPLLDFGEQLARLESLLIADWHLACLESPQPDELAPVGHRPQAIGQRLGRAIEFLPGGERAAGHA